MLYTRQPRNGTARDGWPGWPNQGWKVRKTQAKDGFDIYRVRKLKTSQTPLGGNVMTTEILGKLELELTIDIEELEQKIAPDGGETVLPLPSPHKGKK